MSPNQHATRIDQHRQLIMMGLEYLGVWGYPLLCVVLFGMIAFVSTGGLPFDNGLVNLVFGIVTPLAIEGQAATFVHVARSAQEDGNQGKFLMYMVFAVAIGGTGIMTAALGFYQWAFHVDLKSALAVFGQTPQSWAMMRFLVLGTLWFVGLWSLYVSKKGLTQEKVNQQKEQLRLQTDLQNAQEEAQWFTQQQRATREKDHAAWLKRDEFLLDSQGHAQHTAAMNGATRR